MSSYTDYHKKYYLINKEAIANKMQENHYWQGYYERNKESVKQKALARYYRKKAEAQGQLNQQLDNNNNEQLDNNNE